MEDTDNLRYELASGKEASSLVPSIHSKSIAAFLQTSLLTELFYFFFFFFLFMVTFTYLNVKDLQSPGNLN